VLNLMMDLQQDLGLSYVFISHDLSVVEHIADEVMVMYLGRCVEKGTKDQIFNNPRHPYTQALLRALPEFAQDKARLASLPGVVPGKYDRPVGCLLNPRCPYATDKCRSEEPALADLTGGRQSKCHYPLDDAGRPGL
ncbi:dipeptide ABC transporter ATP-binding protein DppD, partial [Escherichia coli]|nr:dipeptide ABC transporter ATP-binding protein DppD [Escherichia coli]